MRARNIKPGFFVNEILGQADPFLSLLFAGLWCLADREGRLEDRPMRIKAEVFPYRETLDINRYLTELSRLGFIQRYEISGIRLIQVQNFLKHQSPHHTEKGSQLPPPGDNAAPINIDNINGCLPTVNSPLKNGEYPPDSLIPDSLIPDSLIPDSLIHSTPPTPSRGKKLKLSGYDPRAVELAMKIKEFWPDPNQGAIQPDRDKTPVPIVNKPLLTGRLEELIAQGMDPDVLEAIARRMVKEWETGKVWIKAPQYFFGKTEDAPWKDYYRAYLTNKERNDKRTESIGIMATAEAGQMVGPPSRD